MAQPHLQDSADATRWPEPEDCSVTCDDAEERRATLPSASSHESVQRTWQETARSHALFTSIETLFSWPS